MVIIDETKLPNITPNSSKPIWFRRNEAVNKINKPTLSFYSGTNYLRDIESSEYFITRIDKVDIQRYEVIQKRGNYVLLRQRDNES